MGESTYEFTNESREGPGADLNWISVDANPEELWTFLANPGNWKQLSDLWKDIRSVREGEWKSSTPQGNVRVQTFFNEETLTLDRLYLFPKGVGQYVRCRVVPDANGSIVIITNQPPEVTSGIDYEQQLKWTKDELVGIKRAMESR